MTPRLGAIGSVVLDTIERPSSPVIEQLGGAIYSIAALSAARPVGWSVAPILNLGADAALAAMRAIGAMPGVTTEHIDIVPQPNNRVHLRYLDDARRTETLTGGVPTLDVDAVISATAGMSALYINFISGDELTLQTAETLRERFGGFIYADLHSLFLGPPRDAPRRPQPLDLWQRWVAAFDAVQLNEEELALMGQSERGLAEVLHAGPRLVMVTRGARGAVYAERLESRAHSTVRARTVPTPDGAVPGDTTGCGDVWGATCCAALVGGASVENAIDLAHRAAALKIRHGRTEGLAARLSSSNPPEGVLP